MDRFERPGVSELVGKSAKGIVVKMRSMRLADRWLGVPVCFLLTTMRRILDAVRRDVARPIRRVVFIKLAEQGSTVLAYPALRAAVEKWGRENVFFLAFAENRFILDAMKLIPADNVLAIPTTNLAAVVLGAWRMLRRMRRERIDAAVDYEFFSRASAALCYLSGAQHRVGLHASGPEAAWRGDLMSHRLSYNPHIHTADTFMLMVEALAWDPALLPAVDVDLRGSQPAVPQWHATVEDTERVRRLVLGDDSREKPLPIVLLNANCSDLVPLRRWPSERYLDLARRLLKRYPELRVAFTGAPAEAEATAELVAGIQHERCLSLAGRTTFPELLTLYTLSDVLVTNDSGPAHFALLTPIHVVTLFGPETPALYGARSQQNHVVWAGLPCSPCVSAYNDRLSRCRNNLCMQKITVDDVLQKVCEILKQKGYAPAP